MGIADHERQFRQWLSEHQGLQVKVVRAFAETPADQDDLFQEIVLQVWLSVPNFRQDSKPTTWLYRVALNTALAWKRSEKRRGRQVPLPELDPAAEAATGADEKHLHPALRDVTLDELHMSFSRSRLRRHRLHEHRRERGPRGLR